MRSLYGTAARSRSPVRNSAGEARGPQVAGGKPALPARSTVPPPRQRLCIAAILLAMAFCALYGWAVRPIFLARGMPGGERALLSFKILVEMLFVFPAATML